jgi:hypothetical protein
LGIDYLGTSRDALRAVILGRDGKATVKPEKVLGGALGGEVDRALLLWVSQ